ncbi:octopamine receptor-like [Ptychodera flava]|uniref:octopamine receptor-like n=1 Tax=Ptychodera flava TaxID=63121 RepID=UPI003969C107
MEMNASDPLLLQPNNLTQSNLSEYSGGYGSTRPPFEGYEIDSASTAALQSPAGNMTTEPYTFARSLTLFFNFTDNVTARAVNETGVGEGDDEQLGLDPLVTTVAGVILAIIIIVTIVANALILIAFYTHQNLQRRPTNHFYASLAISDLAAGIFVLPLAAYDSLLGMDGWKLGKICCVTWISIDYFVYNASVYVMCAICLDRYMCILHAVYYRNKRSLRLVRGMNVVAWLLGFITSVPGMVLWEPISGVSIIDYEAECFEEWMDNMAFVIVSLIVTIFIPLFMISFLYIRIYLAARYTSPAVQPPTIASASLPLTTIAARYSQPETAATRLSVKGKPTRESEKNDVTEGTTPLPSGDHSVTLQPLTVNKPHVCQTHGNVAFMNDAVSEDRGMPDGGLEELQPLDDSSKAKHRTPEQRSQGVQSDMDGESESLVKASSHEQGVCSGQPESRPNPDSADCPVKTGNNAADKAKEQTACDAVAGKNGEEHPTDDSGDNSESDVVEFERRRQSNANKPKVKNGCSKMTREKSAKKQRRDRRAAKVLGTLVGFFLLSYTPWAVAMIIDSFCVDVCLSPTLYSIAAWLQYSNSIVNPFLYVYNDKDFRVAVANVLEVGLCLCRNRY